jgi:hypothetical protein
VHGRSLTELVTRESAPAANVLFGPRATSMLTIFASDGLSSEQRVTVGEKYPPLFSHPQTGGGATDLVAVGHAASNIWFMLYRRG